ncbi:MAG: DUF3667 domain-containing protein [Acidobacteriota bacterium]
MASDTQLRAGEVICKSCGHRFVGLFCSQCGEKVITDADRRFSHLIREFLSTVTFTDSTFWRTLKTVVLRPGLFSRHVVDGRRTPYMRPLSLFLFANLLYFLFPIFNTFHTSLAIQSGAGSIHGPLVTRLVENRIEAADLSRETYAAAYDAKTKELSKLLLIAVALLFSVPIWLIHSKKEHFYVDSVVLSMEITAFVTLFGIQAQGLAFLGAKTLGLIDGTSEWTVTVIALAIVLYALIRAENFFFRTRGVKALLLSILGILGFLASITAYRALLFVVTFLWIGDVQSPGP